MPADRVLGEKEMKRLVADMLGMREQAASVNSNNFKHLMNAQSITIENERQKDARQSN